MTTATSVGFMLCAILGTCFAVTIWDIFRRLDDHDEQLANLQIIVAGWLPEELDEEPTEEVPVVQPETVPIAQVWDRAAAQLVEQAEVQTVERTVNGFTFRVREEAA